MGKFYNKSDLIQTIQNLESTLGRKPAPQDLKAHPEAKQILGYFKKWDRALKAAGITKPTPVSEPAPKQTAEKIPAPVEEAPCSRRYSKSIISKMLIEECERLGKKPTRKEIDDNKDLPTVSTILKYFDTTRMGDVWKDVLGE